jgi:hypothetical protein
MAFPRIKKFNFNITSTYEVPSYFVGRLDLIAVELFDNVRMYKSIAAANNIKLSHGTRTGIRPQDISIRNELIMRGFTGTNLEAEYQRLIDESRSTNLDWMSYENTGYGYMSEVYEGRLLLIPDFATADLYLNKYEFLTEE